MAKRRRRSSRWASEAAQQALVRFGPEESGIRAARREAESTFTRTVRQADAGARGITYAIDRVRPQVQRDYDEAGLAAARAAHIAEPDLSAAGVPASMRAAVAAERSGFTTRLGESRAASLTELGNRRVQAVEGANFAKQNAQRVLASDLTKLFERAQDLSREKGAFTSSTATELRRAAQQRADTVRLAEERLDVSRRGQNVTKRGQDIAHGDRVADRKADGKDGKGKGGVTKSPDKHEQVASSIEEIAGQASRLLNASRKANRPLSRQQLVKLLEQGRPQSTKETVGKNGQKVKTPIPGRKAYPADLRMSAALDIATGGHLSRETQRRLHARGFSVRQLGLPSYGEFRRKQTPARRAGSVAGTLGAILGLG